MDIQFNGIQFYVDERVYTPTRETEQLIKEVSHHIEVSNIAGYILDLGTGSGALGLSLAKMYPEHTVLGVDISSDALEVAAINATRLSRPNFKMFVSDLLEDIDEEPSVIIADLPWGSAELLLDSNEKIAREPAIAWFPKEGGPMGIYKKVFTQLQKKGWHSPMYFESGCMPTKMVLEAVPRGFEVEYFSYPGYSVTRVQLIERKKTALDLGGRC